MAKRSSKFTHSQALVLKRAVKKMKNDIRIIAVNTKRIAAEVIRLQRIYQLISRTSHNRKVVNSAQEIAASARIRLKSISRQSSNFSSYHYRMDSVMQVVSSANFGQSQRLSQIMTEIRQLRPPVQREINFIKRELIQNQLAFSKMNYLQQLLNLPKRELGCIEIFYIDAYNHVIKRQTELGHRDQAFNLINHLTGLPHHYHFVRVITGKHQMFYRAYVQRVMIEVARDPSAALSVARQKPRMEIDDQQPCRIQLIYLNPQGKVVRIHDSMGQQGAPFVLRRAIHLPANWQLVKIISGSNVKQYRQREQLIELVIKSDGSSSRPRINNNRVRQAFLDYYNAQIMEMTLHSTDYSTRFGYRCAKQYLMGVADAYRGRDLRMKTQLYRRGYQVYHNVIAQKRIHLNSLTDVFLKISRVVIQDAALLDHDLKRRL